MKIRLKQESEHIYSIFVDGVEDKTRFVARGHDDVFRLEVRSEFKAEIQKYLDELNN